MPLLHLNYIYHVHNPSVLRIDICYEEVHLRQLQALTQLDSTIWLPFVIKSSHGQGAKSY